MMRKAQGRARVPLVPEQSSSGWVARVPKQRSSGYGEATPPESFTDGSCFFNASAGSFFSSAKQSPVAQPWNSQSSDPATWGDATPPGSFTNFIQPNLSQQFNFVGESSQFASIQAATEFARFWVPQDFQSKEEFSTFLIHQGTIHMLMLTAVIRHLRLRSKSFGHKMKMSGW